MIPTAEEFYDNLWSERHKSVKPGQAYPEYPTRIQIEDAIEFAKLHVQEALRQASKKHNSALYIKGLYKGAKWVKLEDGMSYNPLENSIMTKTDRKSILNAYPLENIK